MDEPSALPWQYVPGAGGWPPADRVAHVRSSPHRLRELLTDPTAQVLVVWADGLLDVSAQRSAGHVATAQRQLVWRSGIAVDLANAVETIWLGGAPDGQPTFAVSHTALTRDGLANATPLDEEGSRASLRRVGPQLGHCELTDALTAVGMVNWHATHQFCPRCGGPTASACGGWQRVCAACQEMAFPRTDSAVIMAVADDADRLLLARGAGWAADRWSVLAGFVEPGESLEAAVYREVLEETGLRVDDVRYVGSQPWPFPGQLMMAFTARARGAQAICVDPTELDDAAWFTREQFRRAVELGQIRNPAGQLSVSAWLIRHWWDGRRTIKP